MMLVMIPPAGHSLQAKSCFQPLTHINSFNLSEVGVAIISFTKGEKYGTEKLGNLPKVTQLAREGRKIPAPPQAGSHPTQYL